ncbi:MAG: hypothetical protein ACR2O4_03385, partial [Hyphomicrobiaceae bacterium]
MMPLKSLLTCEAQVFGKNNTTLGSGDNNAVRPSMEADGHRRKIDQQPDVPAERDEFSKGDVGGPERGPRPCFMAAAVATAYFRPTFNR